tara:strand:+ start:5276 stop:5575 length:300 start_codon:yes stop_codon:yes gene_type:complete
MDEINNNLITDENMTSQLYLDSMEHLNQLYKKYEIENQKLKDKNNDYKKIILCLYGSINVLYNILGNVSEIDLIIFNLIEGIVMYLNEVVGDMGIIYSV